MSGTLSAPASAAVATSRNGNARLPLPGRPLIVAGWAPPRPGGSSVILGNLLQWFDADDFVLASGMPPSDESRAGALPGVRVRYVSRHRPLAGRGHQLWSTLQIPLAARRLARIARAERCQAIVGVFPDLQHLAAAYLAHRLTGLPFAAYLHDFLVEAGHGSYLGAIARWLQPRLLAEARPLWTMSQGMSDHVRGAYGVASRPLVHAYNEPIPDEPPPAPAAPMQLFFSGTVYSINASPLARISRALTALPGARLSVFGVNRAETLAAAGIAGPHVVTGFIPDRATLIRFMREQHAFAVCLTWPEETWVGTNEMATIFPTKLPEYLAQGRPILVHCPEDYFLARFMREHDCGWVVTERSVDALAAALHEMSTDSELRRRRCANALAAAQTFAGHRVATQFSEDLAQVLESSARRPRVTIPLGSFNLSGGIKVLVLLANGMVARGWSVRVLAPAFAGTSPFPLDPRVDVVVMSAGPSWLPLPLRQAIHYLKLAVASARGVDICLANYYPTAFCGIVSRLPANRRATVAYYVQGYEAVSHGLTGEANAVSRVLRFAIAKLSYRLPVFVLCVSGWVRSMIGRADGVVANAPAIDPTVFRPDGRRPRRDVTVVGVIGRSGSNKGYACFVEALRHLPDRARFRVLVASPRAGEVALPGGVAAEAVVATTEVAMADFYRACDVFVLPSYMEGFPLPGLEAMASGCALVTTDCGGVADYAEPDVNALVVPRGDAAALAKALATLGDDPDLCERLAARGVATASRFEKQRMVDRFLDLLESACRTSRS